jgi:peptide/nickel transport system permease protein
MATQQHPRIRELKYTLSRIFKSPATILGFSLMAVFVFLAVAAPYIAPPKDPYRPYLMPHKGYSSIPKPPSKTNFFGTTAGQYDIYYGIVWGTRTSFKIGIFVVGFALIIGITLGVTAGYFGGWIDEVIMRIVDIMYAIPMVVLAMAFAVAFGRGLRSIIISLALVQWRIYVRLLRAEILTLRERDFIQAAKVMGVSNIVIMFKHILPNAIYPVLIVASLNIGSMVIMAAFLSFLGLGAPVGYSDWGQMVALARDYISGPEDAPFKYWYTIVMPGTAIVLFVLSWNLIGDALRDAFDPRQRRR